MSSYVSDYKELLKIANDNFEDELLQTEASNFYRNLGDKSYYKYLARYYYNKSLQTEYHDGIIIVPKSGYITQRLVYLNDDLVGGTKVGVQAINITEQDGDINLQNVGAVGFCPLYRFFDSLCYAFGIEVDKNKINIYELCNSVLHDFEFIYNKESGYSIEVTGANYNIIHVLYIVEDEKTYFDEDLVQAFANAMYNAGWFTGSIIDMEVQKVAGNVTSVKPITDVELNYLLNKSKELIPNNFSFDYFAIRLGLSRLQQKYPNEVPIQISFNSFQSDSNEFAYITIASVDPSIMGTYLPFDFNEYVTETNFRYGSYVKLFSYGSVHSVAVGKEKYSFGTPNEIIQGYKIKDNPISSSSNMLVSGYVGSDTSLGFGNINVDSSIEFKDGITIIDDYKIPTGLDSLSVDYPSWFSRLKNIVGTAVETVGETLRNAFKVIEFVPLTLLGEKPTEPQDTIQTGIVLSPTIVGTVPEITVKYLTPLPDTDTPISPTSPYYPDNPNYPSDTPVGNPIVDPTNPPAIGGITPPVPDNPIINSSNGLFTVYNPTQEQLSQFGGYLWGEDVVGILQSIFQNPMQAIISLHVLYATPATGDEKLIRLGYMTSNVSAKEVTAQYINIDCGTVDVPEYYGNVLDYSPYTKAHIYLPFIGIREINVNEIMGSQVNVNYKVDVLTGSVYASISVFHNAISQVLYTFEGNCAVQLPMTGGDVTRLLSGMITGMAVGAKGGLTGAIIGTATGAFASGGLSVSKTNSIGANAGAMGIKKPYIIITHSQAYMANNYNTQYGYPSNLTTQLSACKGYTRVKEVHVENILVATQEEKDMIQTLLRQGVIIE